MYDNDRLLRDIRESDRYQDIELIPDHELVNLSKRKNNKILNKIVKTFFYSLVFIIVLFITFYIHGNVAPKNHMAWINNIPLIGQIKQIAEGTSEPLKGEDRGRINILLLGIGGKGHDGGQLTDTIMVLSYDVTTKKVALLSIPRDLSVPIESIGWRKINAVNSYAEQKSPGSGGLATSQTVGNILNAPIDYYVKVDFDGFTQLIDELGGIEVCVDKTFDDYTYPAEGQEDNPDYYSRFEHLHIEQGCQKMDGKLALKYARSRHSLGSEGTDFARAARQQKVIQATKEKLLSANTILNPSMISKLVGNLNEHASTDMKIWEMAKFWSLVKDIKKEDMTTKVLSNSPEGLLVDAKGQDGAYLLLPRTGNFTEVQYLFNNMFGASTVTTKTQEKMQAENAKIQILNGTWLNGLASKAAVDLEKLGFKIVDVANCSRQNFEVSVIYDLTFGAKTEALKLLKDKTGANVSFNLPDWLKEDISKRLETGKSKEQPDLILILGNDANNIK